MAIGQIGSSGASVERAGGQSQGATGASATAHTEAAPRVKTAGVTVTLTPEARQHLSRLEGFAATVGTSKQPKQMAKPGLNIDLRT